MPQIALPRQDQDHVLFTYLGAARSVALAGTFNCWAGDACMLEPAGEGRWQARLRVPTGRHLYKYVIDGEHWIVDPANDWVSEDGQNNSCITIDDTGAVLLRGADVSAAAPGPLFRRHAALASPSWLSNGVIYQLSVAAFGGTFAGVAQRLPYLRELGVSVIWLMPLMPIGVQGRQGSLGDPYAVYDFLALNPALGTEQDLRALVAQMHALGMRVLLDWTLNRSSIDNPLTRQHPEWFTHNRAGEIYYAVPNRTCFAGFDFSSRPLRRYLVDAMTHWLDAYGFDGLRFDDSDITPLDFLDEIRAALVQLRPDIALVSQAYDEFHHLAACDLTYEGATRDMILAVADGRSTAHDFARLWERATFSFPRGALRMRWLEDKEQGRAVRLYGGPLHLAAASLLLTLDGVPHVLMGQEFNEPGWNTWTVLFGDFKLDWAAQDQQCLRHYRQLIALRARVPALRGAGVRFVPQQDAGLIAYWRGEEGESRDGQVLVLVNLGASEVALPEAPMQVLFSHGLAGNRLAAYGTVVAQRRLLV